MLFDLLSLNPISSSTDTMFLAIHDKTKPETLFPFFEESIIFDVLHQNSIRYEDHLQYDVICIWQNLVDEESFNNPMYLFVCKEGIHFVGDKTTILNFIQSEKENTQARKRTVGLVVHRFLLYLANEYYLVSMQIENEITILENEILEQLDDDKNYSKRILHYRKQLLLRKRRLEQFVDIVDYLLDDNNDLYSEYELTRFTILKDRLNRMVSQVTSLLEYVTEVRQALQSAMDTKQNKIMSLFTVITSIFLPLTLIVGWYGMNFKMPEFASDIAYPIVIVISIFVVLFCLFYFKKKKWF